MVGELSAKQADLTLALESVDRLSRSFDIEPIAIKSEMIDTVLRTGRTLPVREQAAQAAMLVARQAIQTDRYDAAAQLLDTVTNMGRSLRDVELIKMPER